MSIIDVIFQPVLGKMCWDVRNGVGSFLTFEFGEPHFKVNREPRRSRSKKPTLVRHSARRLVNIYGDWHLWIYLCDWRFFRNNLLIGDSESPKKDLRQIALDLDGQALINVKVSGSGFSVFEFDLGGRIETQPYLEESQPEEQWMLFQPSGMVFSFRSDGKYSNHMGDKSPPYEWIPFKSESVNIL